MCKTNPIFLNLSNNLRKLSGLQNRTALPPIVADEDGRAGKQVDRAVAESVAEACREVRQTQRSRGT